MYAMQTGGGGWNNDFFCVRTTLYMDEPTMHFLTEILIKIPQNARICIAVGKTQAKKIMQLVS